MDDFERFTGKPGRPLARTVVEVRRNHQVRSSIRINSIAEIEALVRRNSRKRPPGMAPALVEPPRGPRPLSGGAAAALEFDD